MAQVTEGLRSLRFWIVVVGLVILAVFVYFYPPFEKLVSDSIRGLASSTIVFWFAAFVGVVAYVIAHLAVVPPALLPPGQRSGR